MVNHRDMTRKFSRSVKKYIRKEKARIRKNTADLARQKEMIEELYKKVSIRERK